MHECPNCGFACDCDGDDTWNDAAAADCVCGCDEEDDDGADDEEQDYEDDDTAA